MAKPTGPQAPNTGHSLYGRLKFCAPLTEGTGAPKDLISGTTATLTGTPTWGTDARGVMCYGNESGTSDYAQWDSLNLTGFNGHDTPFTGSFTIVVIGLKRHGTDATQKGFVAVGNLGGAVDDFCLDTNHTLMKDANGPSPVNAPTVLTVDTVYDACLSAAATAANGGSGTAIYLNGSSDATNTGISGDSTPTSGSVRILRARSVFAGLNGTIEGVFIYSGQLNSSEISSLIANPWAVVQAAGGGSNKLLRMLNNQAGF